LQGEEVATKYNYDNNSRLINITKNNQEIISYDYDSLNKIKETLWNWIITNYKFDELNRLSSLTTKNNKETINNYSYTYNTNWNIISNWVENYNYDYLNQIIEANYKTRERNKELIEKFSYDSMWNRINSEKIEQTKKRKQTKQETTILNYTTNNLNQYIAINTSEEEKENNKEKYSKLKSFNRINKSEKNEIKYIYDNNWNIIQDNEYKYSYDYKNRLVRVEEIQKKDEDFREKLEKRIKEKSKHIFKYKKHNEWNKKETKIIAEFKYDILWRRIEKKTKDELIKYYYAWRNAIKEEIYEIDDEELKLKETRENIYSNQLDDILATIVTKKEEKHREKFKKEMKNKFKKYFKSEYKEEEKEKYSKKDTKTKIYFYTKNHLNSIVAITDEKAKIIEKYRYDVFGKAYISEWKNKRYKEFKKSKIWNTRLYTGREYDKEIWLYYLRARYYNPIIGRFISRDPIDVRDDVNLYGYVGNGVVMFVDPSWTVKNLLPNLITIKDIWYDLSTNFILNMTGIWWKVFNLDISSYMLAKFMYWDGNSEYYNNDHFISQKLMETDFYKLQIDKMG